MKYHTFWPRFWADFLDGLVFIPIGILDQFLLDPDRGAFVVIIWAIFSISSKWCYRVYLHARYGQTWGKMATNVSVLDVSEEHPPTIRQAFLRDIGLIGINCGVLVWFIYVILLAQYAPNTTVSELPIVILNGGAFVWFLLEVITMLTNEKRRALHDFIAGTVVVRSEYIVTNSEINKPNT